jgi:hypothetical protein
MEGYGMSAISLEARFLSRIIVAAVDRGVGDDIIIDFLKTGLSIDPEQEASIRVAIGLVRDGCRGS